MRNTEVFLCWVLWLASYVSIKGEVRVITSEEVSAQCREPATLTCDVIVQESQNRLSIKELAWLLDGSELCTVNKSQVDDSCNTVSHQTNHSLILTVNSQPSSLGQYTCKLRSNLGVESNYSKLMMQACFQNMTDYWTKSRLGCQFYGVYPAGTVHWFHGLENLTDFATTKMQQDQKGFFNIISTLNTSKTCNCSLWIPGSGKYLYNREVSSGNRLQIQFVLVSIGTIWQFFTSVPF